MKHTLKVVVPICMAAVALIGLNEAGFFHFISPFDKLLTEIGIALLAVGLIHLLDHATLIPRTARLIEKQSREIFKAEIKSVSTEIQREVDNAANSIISKTDLGLTGATDQLTSNLKGAISNASNSIISDVTSKTNQSLDKAQESLLASTREASEILQRQVESIKVMETCNMIAIFPSRFSAAMAVRLGIGDSKEIKLMGISLNEFFRSEQSPFREAWGQLVKSIRAGTKKVKILLVDPYCHGAVLRSYAETANAEIVAGRLETDVLDAANHLRQLRIGLGANADRLEVHFYRLAPTVFLCHLDTCSFVQQYHFWKERISGCPIPLFHYTKQNDGRAGVCVHTEMGQHFDFIWENASIPLDDFLPMPARGLEWGSHVSGIGSVFVDRSRPNNQLREEIKRSKHICIQGITLKSFFSEDSLLSRGLMEKTMQDDPDIDIRVMLLDPDSDQAKERAYREFLLSSESKLSFDDFTQNHYQQSKLVSDLRETMRKIRRLNKNADGPGGQAVDVADTHRAVRIHARKYKTAPHMFLFIGDRSAFVEQYSYGKLAIESPISQRDAIILGSDMPLIEYQKTIDPIYGRVIEEIRNKDDADAQQLRPQPYPLLSDHFEYTWSRAIPI